MSHRSLSRLVLLAVGFTIGLAVLPLGEKGTSTRDNGINTQKGINKNEVVKEELNVDYGTHKDLVYRWNFESNMVNERLSLSPPDSKRYTGSISEIIDGWERYNVGKTN